MEYGQYERKYWGGCSMEYEDASNCRNPKWQHCCRSYTKWHDPPASPERNLRSSKADYITLALAFLPDESSWDLLTRH
jgi:hypothetical protein